MKLKLWGTRGSLPRTMDTNDLKDSMLTYIKIAKSKGIRDLDAFGTFVSDDIANRPFTLGGQTSCSEIIHQSSRIYVDMGTGITDAAQEAMSNGLTEFNILMTHMHWDHIMGLPFFIPIYIPGSTITIYHVHANAPEYIKILFNGINFPVSWHQLPSKIIFKQIKLYQAIDIGGIRVTPMALDHPGGSFGYRAEAGGRSLLIGVDGEYKRLTPKELGRDHPFYQNLDVLLFDGQYEMDELASRFDWGHCSPPIGVDLALREGIKNLILTHHDPRSSDEKGHRMCKEAERHRNLQLPAYKEIWDKLSQPQGPNIFPAYDGLLFDLDTIKIV